MQNALNYARAHQDRFLAELFDLLSIPSVSTDPAFGDDVARAAEWLAGHLASLGATGARAHHTGGHPIVVGQSAGPRAKPTILVYGHYDVQPPDPLDLWISPPFVPEVRNGRIYARGACDDKGQLFIWLKALESYVKTEGSPPVNMKFILEGEEESGSTHLPPYISGHADSLAADVVLISDTALFAPGVPSITCGLRGMAYVEVSLTGPDRDLHSGTYGGAIENPINVLGRLIGGLHDADHRIAISGFYDDVRPLSLAERAGFARLPFDEGAWAREVGVQHLRTEAGFTALEGATSRPTLDCNGIWGGYTGEGAKTVLPSRASAKISMRLVPDQDPADIGCKIRTHFEEHAPATMQVSVQELHGAVPVLVNTDSAAMEAAAQALNAVYKQRPHFVRIGGSIPVVADFKELMGLDCVLMGFGLDSDAIHSPNEHFGVDRFQQGIEAAIRFMALYGSNV